jgi:hypothetical protein
VRTKQKAAVLAEQRLARDRTEAHHDARALALELAQGDPERALLTPSSPVDSAETFSDRPAASSQRGGQGVESPQLHR